MAELGSPAGVLVGGGGVAALESLMALSDLAGDRVRETLVAPEPDFVYRPMAVAEPFGFGEARRYPLRRIVENFCAKLLWWPPTKIAGSYLAPYLYEREAAAAPGPAPERFADVGVPLDTAEAVRG